MYAEYFGLSRMPFEASPDPNFLYNGAVHREALASIEYAVSTRMGFITLIGEVGLGKTTIVRAFLNSYDRDRLLAIYVFHPLLTFDDLLQLVAEELSLDTPEPTSSFNRLRAIQRELIRLYDENRQVLLIIDEAQRLPEDTLENLRLLTNLETDDTKLLQIVLVGQPELEVILAQPHLRQLEQRIMLKARLDSLPPKEAIRYLRHRLALAGAVDPEDVFSAAAISAIVELTAGVPRRMNILANRVLIDAFGADEKPVSATRVRAVARQRVGFAWATPRWFLPVAAVALGVAALGGTLAVDPDLVPGLRAVQPWLAKLWPENHADRGLAATEHPASAVAERSTIAAAITPAAAQTVAAPPTPPSAPTPSATPSAAPSATPAVTSSAGASGSSPAASSDPPADPPSAAAQSSASATPPPPVAAQGTQQGTQQAAADPPSHLAPAAAPAPHAGAVVAATMNNANPAVAFDASSGIVHPGHPAAASAPAAAPADGPPREIAYTVLPGDTLWRICLHYYGPDAAPSMIARVMSRNRIVSDIRLLWGTTIYLPPEKTS